MNVPNDQGDIIEALKLKNYTYVWERVKYIGFKDVANVSERHLVFFCAAQKFDPDKNNNFIIFYKKYLNYFRMDQNDTFRVTSSRANIKKLKEQAISPTDSSRCHLINDLKNWNN